MQAPFVAAQFVDFFKTRVVRGLNSLAGSNFLDELNECFHLETIIFSVVCHFKSAKPVFLRLFSYSVE